MGIVQSSLQRLGSALKPLRAGDEKLLCHRLQRGRLPTLDVTSVGFANGGPIPRHFTQDGDDVSPPIQWSGVPSAAREIVLCCEDPDAPATRPYLHWLARAIDPKTVELQENVEKVKSPATASMIQARNGAKRLGYAGPAPPLGHGVHHYHFQVFALDLRLALDDNADRDTITDAMRGHVLAYGELVGIYERCRTNAH